MNSSIPPDEDSRSSMGRDSLDSRDSIEESLAGELAGFQKIVNAIRLYGEDHEFAISQAGSFLESLRPLLNELGALPLEVRHDSLRFEGVPVIADRDQVGMTVPFLASYSKLLIQTCHAHGAFAMGGMAELFLAEVGE